MHPLLAEPAPAFLSAMQPTSGPVRAAVFELPEVPKLSAMDSAQIPDVRPQAEAAAIEPVLDASTALDDLTHAGLRHLKTVLDMPMPDPHMDHFSTVFKGKLQAANTALLTQTRVDENRLRRKNSDKMSEVLKMMAAAKATLPTDTKMIEGSYAVVG